MIIICFFFYFFLNCNLILNKFFFDIENRSFLIKKINYNKLFIYTLNYLSINNKENIFLDLKKNLAFCSLNSNSLKILKKTNINSIYKFCDFLFFFLFISSNNKIEDKFLYSILNSFIKFIGNNNNIFKEEDFSFFKKNISSKLESAGLGIVYKKNKDGLLILDIVFNSPVYYSCLRINDIILGINFFLSKNLSANNSKNKLKGCKNSFVYLSILNNKLKIKYFIKIKRKEVFNDMFNLNKISNFIYLKFINFSSSSFDSLLGKYLFFNFNLYNGMILDLRNNPGGLLDQCILICNFFLHNSEIILLNCKNKKTFYKSSFYNNKYSKKISILINEYSASASELLSISLKTNNRCFIFGTLSYGKFTIQNSSSFNSIFFIKLTIGYFYLNFNRNVIGIFPDIYLNPFLIFLNNYFFLNNLSFFKIINKKFYFFTFLNSFLLNYFNLENFYVNFSLNDFPLIVSLNYMIFSEYYYDFFIIFIFFSDFELNKIFFLFKKIKKKYFDFFFFKLFSNNVSVSLLNDFFSFSGKKQNIVFKILNNSEIKFNNFFFLVNCKAISIYDGLFFFGDLKKFSLYFLNFLLYIPSGFTGLLKIEFYFFFGDFFFFLKKRIILEITNIKFYYLGYYISSVRNKKNYFSLIFCLKNFCFSNIKSIDFYLNIYLYKFLKFNFLYNIKLFFYESVYVFNFFILFFEKNIYDFYFKINNEYFEYYSKSFFFINNLFYSFSSFLFFNSRERIKAFLKLNNYLFLINSFKNVFFLLKDAKKKDIFINNSSGVFFSNLFSKNIDYFSFYSFNYLDVSKCESLFFFNYLNFFFFDFFFFNNLKTNSNFIDFNLAFDNFFLNFFYLNSKIFFIKTIYLIKNYKIFF